MRSIHANISDIILFIKDKEDRYLFELTSNNGCQFTQQSF